MLTYNETAITLPPATVPYPNSGALAINGDYVWVQLAYDDVAKTLTTATSSDGVTYTTFGAPMSTTQYLNQPGGFRIGVFGKRDSATANKNVELESFTLESTAAAPVDTTAPTTTHTLARRRPTARRLLQVGRPGHAARDDNNGGSGVDKTEYREQGAASWTAYSAPFTVSSDGSTDDRVPLGRQEGQHRADQDRHGQARQDRTGHDGQAQRRGAEGRLHR